jgi:gliding motility-associated-like protein
MNSIAYQPAASFTGLVPANYTIVAKNTSTQCVSAATVAVINAVPLAPPAPTFGAIIQPTCTVLKGTITINTPIGSTLEYSINGINYQKNTSFNNLSSGTFNFAVRDIVTSCISTATAASINPSPVLPTAPIASITVQPSCVISAGTIVISAPAGSNYEYSIDGLQYQTATSYTGLAPNIYTVTVKDLSTSCISSPTILVVKADISLPGKYLIPTAFSPNSDGINDCFGIKFWGVVSEFQLIIYNRWGETVFSTTNPANCWDGMYKSVGASQGNYVYFIKAKTLCGPVEKKGNVLLVK